MGTVPIGTGTIANDPFPRRVNVLAGGQIHHGVGAPLGRPTHLFHFLIDGGSDRRVSDVGVDLHQEVPPNDHRLAFGMVDVDRNDRTTSGDFGSHELGRDKGRSHRAPGLPGMLVLHAVPRNLLGWDRSRTGEAFHSRRASCTVAECGRKLREVSH